MQRAATPVVEDPTPAQYHDTTTTSRDRAYHLAREGGLARDVARQVANAAVEQARRTRGC